MCIKFIKTEFNNVNISTSMYGTKTINYKKKKINQNTSSSILNDCIKFIDMKKMSTKFNFASVISLVIFAPV